MKKLFLCGLVLICVCLTSFEIHKFYVAIFQVTYAPEKKMLQLTTRIFADDLNKALQKKYDKRFHLGEKEEAPEESTLLQQYLTDQLKVNINNRPQKLIFVSKELESNVLVCYIKIIDVPKITLLAISNEILFDYVTEQQNIIQTNVYGKKDSKLLTVDAPTVKFKY